MQNAGWLCSQGSSSARVPGFRIDHPTLPSAPPQGAECSWFLYSEATRRHFTTSLNVHGVREQPHRLIYWAQFGVSSLSENCQLLDQISSLVKPHPGARETRTWACHLPFSWLRQSPARKCGDQKQKCLGAARKNTRNGKSESWPRGRWKDTMPGVCKTLSKKEGFMIKWGYYLCNS